MFEFIASKIDSIFGKLLSKDKLTAKNIQEGIKEIRKALLDADVNYKVVNLLLQRVSDRAIGETKISGITPSDQFVKIFYDELVKILAHDETTIKITKKPSLIFLVGLQGSGKTTTCVKLANFLKQEGKNVLTVGADTFRPAAKEQLKQLAEKSGISFFTSEGDDLNIIKESIKFAKSNNIDVVVVDTQGRLHIQKELMEHIKKLYDETKPDYVFYVVDSMVGQDAVNQASVFLS
ncbi:MAG: signal recognition particle receptor subunit alpha, partial [Planctomycetota bacterium]